MCPKASFKAAAELGRYSAAVSSKDLLYTESFYGVSFGKRDSIFAFVLSAIVNSSLTAFQLAFGGGAWGLERSTVEPKDLLSLRVPDFFARSVNLAAVVQAEAAAALNYSDQTKLCELDRAVFELYGLEPDETVLASESVNRACMLIFEGRAQRQRLVKPPISEMLGAYASAVVRVVDRYLRAKSERHLEATIYRQAIMHASWAEGSPGLTAVRFSMAVGAPNNAPAVRQSGVQETNGLGELLRSNLQSGIAPYLNERRLLRVYSEHDLFLVKPSEARYWTQTAGLNDADIILADHWLGERHAVHA